MNDIKHIGTFSFSAAGRQFIHLEAITGAFISFGQGHIVSNSIIKVVKPHDLQSHRFCAQVVEKEEPVLYFIKAGPVADDLHIRLNEKSFTVLLGMFA